MYCVLTVPPTTAPIPPTADTSTFALAVVAVAVGTLYNAGSARALSSTPAVSTTAVSPTTMPPPAVATPLLGYRSLYHLVDFLFRGNSKAHLGESTLYYILKQTISVYDCIYFYQRGI